MRNHANRSHALLSASGATRWMSCTGSALLEAKYPDSDSEYAAEGTLAHELSEIELQKALGMLNNQQYTLALRKIRKNDLFTLDMPRYVDQYVTIVLEQYRALQKQYGEDQVFISIEERVDFSNYVPEGFGTGDIIIVYPVGLHVMDLKYGKGVPVYADNNSQLKLYGVGAVNAYDLIVDIQTVTLHIVQPRLDSYSIWDISIDDLLTWAEDDVKPLAEEAYSGEGNFKAGDWCRWCRAKASCRALADYNLELAALDFADPNELTDEELIEVRGKMDLINTWSDAVKEYMYKEALKGKDWDGYKLVAGTSRRSWKDTKEVIKRLRGAKYNRSQYINSKLKGIGDVSSLMSVDDFEELLQDQVHKPEGKPTLVPDDDKRLALNDPVSDFDDGYDDLL